MSSRDSIDLKPSKKSDSESLSFSESCININRYQYGGVKEYSTISTIVPVEVKLRFIEKCRELGLTPSEVLRQFVLGFTESNLDIAKPRQINININMALAKAESRSEVKSSLEELILREELEDLLSQAKDLESRLQRGADRVWIRETARKLRREIIKTLKQYSGDLPENLKEEVLAALRLLRGLSRS